MSAERLLIVDDDPGVVELWLDVFGRAGYGVDGVTDPAEGLRRACEGAYDLVLCDVEMPGMRGPELLERLIAARPDQLVILITAFGSIQTAVEALRAGAADFVSKPIDAQTLLHRVGRTLRERTLRREVVRLRRRLDDAAEGEPSLVARSPAMQRVVELARRVAHARGPVLLQGESGTGKTAIAKLIHQESPRRDKPFVAINASTLPEAIAEAELFGVRKGAFTDATQDRPGLLRSADGGTVFLDEVADLPASVQAKLLTVLEGGRLRAVGDTREFAVDVRVIAASNVDLEQAVAAGRFRSDLRFRLDVLTLRLPPLRERREDLAPLVDLWMARLAARHGRETLGISMQGWRWLYAWGWPGNVRELINRLERAIVFSDHDFLTARDFEEVSREPREEVDRALLRLAADGVPLAEVEDRYIRAALEVVDGNKSEAARRLGIDRRTLYRRLDEPE